MIESQLRDETCRECGCEIHVAPYSPWAGDEPTADSAAFSVSRKKLPKTYPSGRFVVLTTMERTIELRT